MDGKDGGGFPLSNGITSAPPEEGEGDSRSHGHSVARSA